jgi:transcriptional regulator with XRE-family HTH domain
MPDIGKLLSQLLVKNNLTAVDLATKLNLTKQAVYSMLKKPNIDTGLLEKIANVLDVPISYFFTPENSLSIEEYEEIIKDREFNNEAFSKRIKELEEYLESSKRDLFVLRNYDFILLYDIWNLLSKNKSLQSDLRFKYVNWLIPIANRKAIRIDVIREKDVYDFFKELEKETEDLLRKFHVNPNP